MTHDLVPALPAVPLVEILDHFLTPSPAATLLLRAGLLTGDAVPSAWRDWCRAVGDPKQFLIGDRVGVKRHLPLIHANLIEHGVAIDRELLPYLRTAQFRHEIRDRTFRRLGREGLAALADAGLDVIVLKGAAVGELAYPAATPRHSHDLDVWIPDDRADRALRVLAEAGFDRPGPGTRGDSSEVRHRSGLPISIHRRLYATEDPDEPMDAIRARARSFPIFGVPVRIFSPADLLFHVVAHAATSPARATLAWAFDASRLIGRPGDRDWDIVVNRTRESRLVLPVVVLLTYLARSLDADVPPGVLEELGRQARQADPARRRAALDGLRAGVGGGMRAMVRVGGWRSRLALFPWLLRQAPGRIRWALRARLRPGGPAPGLADPVPDPGGETSENVPTIPRV